MKALSVVLLALFLIPNTGIWGQETRQSPHSKLDWNCLDCHNTQSWSKIEQPMKFQHEETGFALIGAHSSTACATCHRDLKFSQVGTACADCHTDIHRGQFGSSCQNCHAPQSWQDRKDNFSLHSSRGFPLVGVHAIADCGSCHIGQERNEFAGTSQECQVCHRTNFAESKNPDHELAGFSGECQQCHQPVAASWHVTNFRHSGEFVLRAAHAQAECSSCHSTQYAGMSFECNACHMPDFNATTDPSHAAFGFPTTCQACHSDLGWETAQFDHILSSQGFALNGAHGSIACTDCHVNNQLSGLPRDCFGCHQADYMSVTDPSHSQGNFPQTCLTCHNENAWAPAAFDHNQSAFPLTGAHTSVACGSCHASGYQDTPADCYTCHTNDFNSVSDPNHVSNNFPHDCTQCHTTAAWEPATFSHSLTDFPLTGAHVSAACNSCHASGYQNTPTECYACHQGDYNSATDPNHVQNNFDHNCTQCHNTTSWEPSTFNHAGTQFPLTGAHTSLSCVSCHAAGYQNTPTDCYSCHDDDYNSTTNPNHAQNNFDHNCTQCHSTSAWLPSTFNHATTQFPLTGAHTSTPCISCHAAGYQDTPMECYACHQSDYNGADDPNHVQNSFDHDCTQCHSTSVWVPSTFNHSNTQFPLTGRHLELQCNECHDAGYQIPFDCWSCHEADYHGAEDHDANNFPHDCTQCHNTNDWGEGGFNHNNTLFPLTGAHLTIQCIDCHAGGYQDIPTACYSCHDQDYSGVDDPDHVIDNFSQDCTQCHTTTAWLPANYDHNLSQFPLTGAHVGVPCASCHATGFDNTAMECFGCHQDDFNSVPDPNHVVNGFDHVCTQCHTTAGWTPATYDHSGTQFPLTGAHTSLPCASCHANGFDNTPFECYACHQADYDGVVEPSHTQNNFDHDCTQCHGTNAWLPSTFNHGQTQFPLTGAHMSVPCISCHAGGYENTPMDCYSCHQTDYENVPDPDHELNNFSHICIECHNTNAWLPTTFNHNQTLFPLTGAHTVLPCISCHADGYDNMPLECYACHQPDFEGVADPNHVANDYDHLCTQCHTTAAWSPATYDHNLTQFPLTGAHISAPCASCHANGFENTPMECFACHQSDYNNTDPSHQAMGFPTTCQDCHNTNAWDPSTWFHDAQYFPIFSGRHEGEWSACGDCHVNPNDFTVFECIFCHEHNQPDTDDRHTEVIGYQYNSQACYNCHPTGDGGGRRGK